MESLREERNKLGQMYTEASNSLNSAEGSILMMRAGAVATDEAYGLLKDRLAKALRLLGEWDSGGHGETCETWQTNEMERGECNCGLSEARALLEEES
jgi:hypothetical protein